MAENLSAGVGDSSSSFQQLGVAADVSTGGGRLELANDAELKSRFAFRIAACWGDQEDEDSPAWMYSQDLPVDVRACHDSRAIICFALLTPDARGVTLTAHALWGEAGGQAGGQNTGKAGA